MNYINCPECTTSFLPFRVDQEFCSVRCRVKHNNAKAKDQRDRWKKLSEILHNNVRILDEELGSLNEKMVDGQTLIQKGYLPNYITQMEVIDNKKVHMVVDIMIEVDTTQTVKLKRI